MKRKLTSRTVFFAVLAACVVCVALLILACVMRADVESIRQESMVSVPSDPVSSRAEKALESMAKAFHGWQR